MIALASDFRIAVPSARLASCSRGWSSLAPTLGARLTLAACRRSGSRHELCVHVSARPQWYTDNVSSPTALEIGFSQCGLEHVNLMDDARALATRLAAGPAFALA